MKYKWALVRSTADREQNVIRCPILSSKNPQTGERKIGRKNGIEISYAEVVGEKLYISQTRPVEMLLKGRTPPYVKTQFREITQKQMPRLLKSRSHTFSDSSTPDPEFF